MTNKLIKSFICIYSYSRLLIFKLTYVIFLISSNKRDTHIEKEGERMITNKKSLLILLKSLFFYALLQAYICFLRR